MRVDDPKVIRKGEKVKYQVQVEFSAGETSLWYRLDEKYADLVSDRSDAALVALLIPAMSCGEDIHLAGTISERLYYNLSRPYQHVLQAVIPSLKLVDIYPANVQPATDKANGVATGFSAGVDSFSVLADHHYADDVPSGFRLTHLLYSIRKRSERLFRKRLESNRPVLDRIGLPVIAVMSNIESFYEPWSFQQTHTPRRTSVAHLLQNGIGRFMYASTYNYVDIFVGKAYDLAYSDPVAIPLLSNRSIATFSVGSEYTRVEKTLQIADIKDTHKWLTVCVNDENAPGENCSTCWKCRRTLLTLEIAGLLSRYEDVFDLDAYQRGRRRYIARVLQSEDPLLREVISFAEESGFDFPLYSKMRARVHNLLDDVKSVFKILF